MYSWPAWGSLNELFTFGYKAVVKRWEQITPCSRYQSFEPPPLYLRPLHPRFPKKRTTRYCLLYVTCTRVLYSHPSLFSPSMTRICGSVFSNFCKRCEKKIVEKNNEKVERRKLFEQHFWTRDWTEFSFFFNERRDESAKVKFWGFRYPGGIPILYPPSTLQ